MDQICFRMFTPCWSSITCFLRILFHFHLLLQTCIGAHWRVVHLKSAARHRSSLRILWSNSWLFHDRRFDLRQIHPSSRHRRRAKLLGSHLKKERNSHPTQSLLTQETSNRLPVLFLWHPSGRSTYGSDQVRVLECRIARTSILSRVLLLLLILHLGRFQRRWVRFLLWNEGFRVHLLRLTIPTVCDQQGLHEHYMRSSLQLHKQRQRSEPVASESCWWPDWTPFRSSHTHSTWCSVEVLFLQPHHPRTTRYFCSCCLNWSLIDQFNLLFRVSRLYVRTLVSPSSAPHRTSPSLQHPHHRTSILSRCWCSWSHIHSTFHARWEEMASA